jgi:hypothetical protein
MTHRWQTSTWSRRCCVARYGEPARPSVGDHLLALVGVLLFNA